MNTSQFQPKSTEEPKLEENDLFNQTFLDQKYIDEGKAKFNALLITLNSDSLETWGDILLDELSNYVNALQAAFYIQTDEAENSRLELISVYGQSRHNIKTSFHLGESLVGQAAKSRRSFSVSNPKVIHTRSSTSLVTIQPNLFL